MKLILKKVGIYKTYEDAFGDARNFVPLPRDINRTEERLKTGEELTFQGTDLARRQPVYYSVQIIDESKPVEKPVEKTPEPVSIPDPIRESVEELDDTELQEAYQEYKVEMEKRGLIFDLPVKEEQGIKVSKATKKRRSK